MKRVVRILAVLSALLCAGLLCVWAYSNLFGPRSVGTANESGGLYLTVNGSDASLFGWLGGRDRTATPTIYHGLGLMIAIANSPGGSSVHIVMPYWFVIGCTAILPAIHVSRLRRFLLLRSRQKHGLCLACGYDLRESKERCPECGTPTSAKA